MRGRGWFVAIGRWGWSELEIIENNRDGYAKDLASSWNAASVFTSLQYNKCKSGYPFCDIMRLGVV